MTEPKLCKDCKWYRKEWTAHIFTLTHIYDTCACPHTSQNLVTGNENRFCHILRSQNLKQLDCSCGPEAKYFEPK